MAKRKKKPGGNNRLAGRAQTTVSAQPPRSGNGAPIRPIESQGTTFVTVAWMQSVLMGGLAELGWAITHAAMLRWPELLPLDALRRVLGIGSLVIALVVAGLMAAVLRVRRDSPPRNALVMSFVVAALPFLGLIVYLVRG